MKIKVVSTYITDDNKVSYVEDIINAKKIININGFNKRVVVDDGTEFVVFNDGCSDVYYFDSRDELIKFLKWRGEK